MVAPLTPAWDRPSHPDIQDVIITENEAEFTSKSLSKVAVPPFGLFAKMSFPPCTLADSPTYATVQFGRGKHLNLNSDLLYINHSCEPSLIFDTTNLNVLAGPKGLKPGDELTFFYPSTEWDMAQPFDCFCGAPSCRGRISGAKDMTDGQLEGVWLNGHIRDLLEEQKALEGLTAKNQESILINSHVMHIPENGNCNGKPNGKPNGVYGENDIIDADRQHAGLDPTAEALRDALQQAEKVVVAARAALLSYAQTIHNGGGLRAAGKTATSANGNGSQRRGPTSRELSGEMGGDTATICT